MPSSREHGGEKKEVRAHGTGELWRPRALVLLSVLPFPSFPPHASPSTDPFFFSCTFESRTDDTYVSCIILEALVFACDFIADLAASPGHIDDSPPVVFFTTTTQNVLKFTAVAAALALAAAAAAAAAVDDVLV